MSIAFRSLLLICIACGPPDRAASPDAGGDAGVLPTCSGTPLEASGVLDVDLAVAHITGHVTLDGAPLPSGASGALVFTETKTNVKLSIPVRAAYDVMLAPGVYSIAFASTSCTGPTPCNSGVLEDGVAIPGDGVLDLDIPTVTVTGHVTSNGGAIDSSSIGWLTFALANHDPANIRIGATYSATLLPGTYAVGFRGYGACVGPLPCNAGPLKNGVALTSSGVLDIDIPAVTVTGHVTLNHGALPATTSQRLSFALGDDAGAQVYIASSYSATLLPGTYAISYVGAGCGGQLPCNSGVLENSTAITTSGVLDIDIPAVDVTGKVTLNGAPLPASSYGELAFALDHHDPAVLAVAPSYAVKLLPGTYEVDYAAGSAGSCQGPLPCSSGPIKPGVAITTSGTLDLDIPAVHLSGAVTLNKAALPASGRGELSFAPSNGKPALVAVQSSYTTTVLPGTFTVSYRGLDACDGSLPCNAGPIKTAIAVTQDGVLDVDIPAVAITGQVTLAGKPMPDASASRGDLGFALNGGGVGRSRSFSPAGALVYSVTILPGRYIVVYDGNAQLCAPTTAPSPPCTNEIVKGCP